MKRFFLFLVLGFFIPASAMAWWNDEWSYKKKISLETQVLTQSGASIPNDAYALIRLHTGNFGYFLELAEQGQDFRVLAADEKTPLKFFIDKLDVINEMALIWVKLPSDMASLPEPAVWLYFGNPKAADAQDAPGSFDVAQMLTYPINKAGIKDLSANQLHPTAVTATVLEGGLIGEAAAFAGSQSIEIPASPALPFNPAQGWTFSAWVKGDQSNHLEGTVFQISKAKQNLSLSIRNLTPVIDVLDSTNSRQTFNATSTFTPESWHHLALVVSADKLLIYVDGKPAGTFASRLPELTEDITLGNDARGFGYVGLMDHITLYKTARDGTAIQFDHLMQGPNSGLLSYASDASSDDEEGGESYVMATLDNVTIDGWVIIGILAIMFLISWLVMFGKAIVLVRTQRENRKFETAFSQLSSSDISNLDHEDEDDQEDFEESPLLLSLTGNHAAFAGSSIYRIYHVGVQEMTKRLPKSLGADAATHVLSAQSLNAVKASMDAVLVRELQKLNSQMVLLTIAISGGPFLGLLGTVVGVMITFAAIAVSGEVNVNAIAPGIAAALTATVAGLAVAIPALFGYNYLGSRIKVISADMHVFVDEFVAKLAEQHS